MLDLFYFDTIRKLSSNEINSYIMDCVKFSSQF